MVFSQVGFAQPLIVSLDLSLSGRTVFTFEGGLAGQPMCSGLSLVRKDLVPITTTTNVETTNEIISPTLLPVVSPEDTDDYTMVYLLGK